MKHYINDPHPHTRAYGQTPLWRLGSCTKHGGTDPEDECEWCELNRLFNGDACLFDPEPVVKQAPTAKLVRDGNDSV